MKTKFEKRIKIFPAWDKRSSDPKEDYGIHGVEIAFTLIGAKGAITWEVFTNWQLPHVQEDDDKQLVDHDPILKKVLYKPMGAGIGFHYSTPQYKGHSPVKCDYVKNGECYPDAWYSGGDSLLNILIEKGSDGVWKFLIKEYKERFEK